MSSPIGSSIYHDQQEVNKMIDVMREVSRLSPEGIEEMLFEVAKINPGTFVHAYNRISSNTKTIDLELSLVASSGSTFIQCIKKYREVTGCGLKEAKIYIESLNLFNRE